MVGGRHVRNARRRELRKKQTPKVTLAYITRDFAKNLTLEQQLTASIELNEMSDDVARELLEDTDGTGEGQEGE